MTSRCLARTLVVLSLTATLVVGLASAAHAEVSVDYNGSVQELYEECREAGGAFFESNDGGTLGVCIQENGVTKICDDLLAVEDNCTIYVESKFPTGPEKREALVADLDIAGPPGAVKRVPRGMRVLLDVVEVVGQPGYCGNERSRRTQVLLEAVTVALFEGDRSLGTCESSDQPSPPPRRGDDGSPDTSPSTTSTSTTLPPGTTTSSGPFLQ